MDEAAKQLLQTIYDESIKALEGLKSAAEAMIKTATEDAHAQFNILVTRANTECVKILGKGNNPERKKAATNAMIEYSDKIGILEKQVIQSIQDTWQSSENKLKNVVGEAKGVSEKQAQDLEAALTKITEQLEKHINECAKLIRNSAKNAQNTLSNLCKKMQ
ncbi:uncharacterized protein [Euwallacea fornicatus]|uniref:uncharacterized protein n=1 Tax=Euwallacea fornicatus TaxID=995702 RepID=UPI00338E4F91